MSLEKTRPRKTPQKRTEVQPPQPRPGSAELQTPLCLNATENDLALLNQQARTLVAHYGFILKGKAEALQHPLALMLSRRGLELHVGPDEGFTPLWIDFSSTLFVNRRRQGRNANPVLARALGIKGPGLKVIDATAGLGTDAYIMASWGCDIQACERSPIFAALLEDGLARALDAGGQHHKIAERIRLHYADAKDYLNSMSALQTEACDVLYVDPVLGEEGHDSSAKVKKGMQLIRQLCGHTEDATELLQKAVTMGFKRIVVKRPFKAPELIPNPTQSFSSPKTRYDVYIRSIPNAS